MIRQSKICTQCNTKKEPFEFYKQKNSSDGLTYHCIDCFKKNKQLYYLKHKKEIHKKKQRME